MTDMNPPQDSAGLTRFIRTRFHVQHREQLLRLARLAEGAETEHFHDDDLSEGVCATWTALYTRLTELLDYTDEHMRLENDELFPQFESA